MYIKKNRFYADWWDGSGSRRRKSFKTAEAAKRYEATQKARAKSAKAIARLAEKGQDISSFFTNQGRIMEGIQTVSLDFTAPMLAELDNAATEMNISRQAVIKTLVRQGLDQHYLAAKQRSA